MSFSSRVMRDADWPQLRHFTPREFRNPQAMGFEFMQWLDELREQAGVPIVTTSDYRTKRYNATLPGAAKDSAHTEIPCDSIDIGERPRPNDPNWNYSRFQIVSKAIQLGCSRIGLYANGSIHLDMTHEKRPAPRMWRVVR